MSNNRAFARATLMAQTIKFILQSTASPILRQILIHDLGEYKSRGHGGKHLPTARFGFAFAQHAASRRGKYSPHQGKREIARRLAHG